MFSGEVSFGSAMLQHGSVSRVLHRCRSASALLSTANPCISYWCPQADDVETPAEYDIVKRMMGKRSGFWTDHDKGMAKKRGEPVEAEVPEHLRVGPYWGKTMY